MKKNTQYSLVRLCVLSLLSAIAFVLMLWDFPLLPSASYLKMDFSDIPAVFAGVIFGPFWGVLVELIKNLLQMLVKGLGSQMGFGNLQSFIVGSAFLLPFSAIYRRSFAKFNWSEKKKTVVKIVLASTVAIISILTIGFLSNLLVAPLFFKYVLGTVLTGEKALAAAIVSVPFNAIKGAILVALCIPLLKLTEQPVKKILNRSKY